MRAPAPEAHADSPIRVPARWRKDVERILITDDEIARRIRGMSRDIERDFTGREMVVVSLLNGTVMFLADLIRNLSLPLRLDFIGVSSYGAGTESGNLVLPRNCGSTCVGATCCWWMTSSTPARRFAACSASSAPSSRAASRPACC